MAMTVTPTASTPQLGRVADDPDPEVAARAQRRRYPAAYKQKVLAEYESLDRAGKGALLRREGRVHLADQCLARAACEQALGGRSARRPAADPRDRELARLRRENGRMSAQLDKARP
jgi:transposase